METPTPPEPVSREKPASRSRRASSAPLATPPQPRPEPMIKGLKVKVPSEEMVCHLNRRAKFHSDRADELAKDIPELKGIIKRQEDGMPLDAQEVSQMSKYANYSSAKGLKVIVQEMESDMRNRRNRALSYQYIAQHLFTDRTYMLDIDDLQLLEIVQRW